MFVAIVFTMFAQEESPSPETGAYDVIIRNGTLYDGTGGNPRERGPEPDLIPHLLLLVRLPQEFALNRRQPRLRLFDPIRGFLEVLIDEQGVIRAGTGRPAHQSAVTT